MIIMEKECRGKREFVEVGRFQGFPKEMFEFFMALSFNNSIEFFNEHRKEYEKYVKQPLYDLAADLSQAALLVDADMEVRPSKAVSRIRRDTRFSKSKLPYRDYMWIGFRRQGLPKSDCFSLYFDISCEHVRYGAGWYDGDPARAKAIRAAIVRRQDEFLKIVSDKKLNREFELMTEPYKRMEVPDTLHKELVPFYVSKSFYYQHEEVTGKQVLEPSFGEQIAKGFEILKPVYTFLLEETWKKADEIETEKSLWEGFFG